MARYKEKRPRTCLIGGYRNNKLIAPVLFNGNCNTAVFNEWLTGHLLKTLKPGSVIVMESEACHLGIMPHFINPLKPEIL